MGDENIHRWSVRKHIYIPSTDSYSVVNEDVVSASDHDRIVAELRAEVFAVNHKLDKHRAANKMLEEIIARQVREAEVSKAVIEKLKRCLLGFVEYFRAIKNGEVGPPRERLRSFEMVLLDSSNSLLNELASIERAEGEKE